MVTMTPSTVVVGPLAVEVERPRATLHGRSVVLRPREHSLLLHLLRNHDRVHPRDAIMRDALDGDGGPRTVDVHVARLRKALRDAGRAIVTVKRVGYRFDPERLR